MSVCITLDAKKPFEVPTRSQWICCARNKLDYYSGDLSSRGYLRRITFLRITGLSICKGKDIGKTESFERL